MINKFTIERGVSRFLDRIADNPVRWALYSVLAGIVVGGTIFSIVEPNASIPDGMWWAYVSMSTVGYGDLSPASDFMRFVAMGVIATGLSAVAILTGALAGRIAKRQIKGDFLETPELDDDLAHVINTLDEIRPTLDHIHCKLKEKNNEQVPQ